MDYKLIQGSFVILFGDTGLQPDGDTVRFLPDDPQLVRNLKRQSNVPPRLTERGINVRLEAVDALETHFQNTHQEPLGAYKARDELLNRLGFTNVVFSDRDRGQVESADQDRVPGHVLSNGIDSNGRMIAFVYEGSGDGTDEDGSTISVDTGLINQSVNAMLLEEGHTYPIFYDTLPEILREALAEKSQAARKDAKGLWARAIADVKGHALIPNLKALTNLVIWPKLFRRLVDYFHNSREEGLAGFKAWLREDVKRDDAIFRLDTKENVHLHDVVDVSSNNIQLKVWPEFLIIQPNTTSST